jgi:hypothetical protein
LFSHADLYNTKVLLYIPQEIFKFLGIFSPLKDFGSSTLGLNVLALLEVFLTSRFRMTIVSSAASNRSLNFTVREMYKLPVLSMLLFPQSINDRAFFTLFTNHS